MTAKPVFNIALQGHTLTACDNDHLESVLVFSPPCLALVAIVSAMTYHKPCFQRTLILPGVDSAVLAIFNRGLNGQDSFKADSGATVDLGNQIHKG
jgi:hypothetical protein